MSDISEDELNAFVDSQLSATDRARVLEALGHDRGLQTRLGEIQRTRNLLRHAYAHPPLPPRSNATAPSWQRQMLAASVLVCVGVVTGWLAHNMADNKAGNGAGNGPSATLQDPGTPKGVVIQVSDADPAKWQMALINAVNVRKAYGDLPVGVEIVAYGPGLKMLRDDSTVAAGLADARKNGVKLLACGNTMNMTQTRRDQLNSGVEVVPAGIVEIMQRQLEGYAYVRP